MQGHATRRQILAGVLAPRGVRAGTNVGRRRPWPSPDFFTPEIGWTPFRVSQKMATLQKRSVWFSRATLSCCLHIRSSRRGDQPLSLHQAQLLIQVRVPRDPVRRPIGTLAPAFPVPPHPLLKEPIHGAKRRSAASVLEVIGPSADLLIDRHDPLGDRYEALLRTDYLAPLLSLSRTGLGAWYPVEKPLHTPESVRLVPPAVAEKVPARSWVLPLDYPGFLVVDLSAHPTLHGGFYPLADAPTRVSSGDNKIIGLSHQPSRGPPGP